MVEGDVLRYRFGIRDKGLLAKRNLTLGDLVRLSQLPRGRLERILAGTYGRLTLSDMESIARVLGTSLYDLLAPTEDPKLGSGTEDKGKRFDGPGRQ